jgi:nitroreductase
MKPEECVPVRRELSPGPEQVEQFLKSRRSIRVFKPEPVPRDALAKLIDIARYAPSGSNRQPVQWLVVESPELVKRLSWLVTDWMRVAIAETPEMADRLPLHRMTRALERGIDPILRGAPHVILAHAPKDQPSAQQDGLIALTYLELAAYSLGLGACWAGFLYFAVTSYRPMREALQFPPGNHCLGAMMIGYPKHGFRRIPLRNEPEIIWR